MDTIDAYEAEINMQPDALRSFVPQRPLGPGRRHGQAIFSGSGDSLAASMLAESFSEYGARAADPLDLYRNPPPAGSGRVCVVSVSGNTAAGIGAARRAGRLAAVVTSDPRSRLARAAAASDPSCRLVRLAFPGSGTFTAGSISFLESALACVSLVVPGLAVPRGCGRLLARAGADAREALGAVTAGGRVFVLGDMFTYPLAMYCAAKFYEVLGRDARYCRTEQFSHMELFSARRGDCVVMFERRNRHNAALADGLEGEGIGVVRPDMPSGRLPQMVYCTFFSQMVTLHAARQKGMRDCHFVTAGGIRGISDRMIY